MREHCRFHRHFIRPMLHPCDPRYDDRGDELTPEELQALEDSAAEDVVENQKFDTLMEELHNV